MPNSLEFSDINVNLDSVQKASKKVLIQQNMINDDKATNMLVKEDNNRFKNLKAKEGSNFFVSLFKANIGACIIEDLIGDDEDENPIEQERKIYYDFSSLNTEQNQRGLQNYIGLPDSLLKLQQTGLKMESLHTI